MFLLTCQVTCFWRAEFKAANLKTFPSFPARCIKVWHCRFSRLLYRLLPHTFTRLRLWNLHVLEACVFVAKVSCRQQQQLLFVVCQPQRKIDIEEKLNLFAAAVKCTVFFMSPAKTTKLQTLISNPALCVCYSIMNKTVMLWRSC